MGKFSIKRGKVIFHIGNKCRILLSEYLNTFLGYHAELTIWDSVILTERAAKNLYPQVIGTYASLRELHGSKIIRFEFDNMH